MDFGPYLNRVRKIYNRYSSSSCSREYENSFGARADIEKVIEDVKGQVSGDTAFDTKQNAVYVLLDIVEEILEGDGSTLGSEARKMFDYWVVGKAVDHILAAMHPDELHTLKMGGNMFRALSETKAHADRYCLILYLDDPLNGLRTIKAGDTADNPVVLQWEEETKRNELLLNTYGPYA
jgi:hypothetical protein